MKLCCSFLLAVMALCVFADDPATKSLKDYETELRREFPFVEHKKGDKVAFVIDNGETKVSGTVVRVNAKGVMVEENGTGIFYSFQRLGVEGGRFFLPEKYNEWIGQLALVKKAEADKFRLLQIAERQKAEQQKKLEEQRKADAAKGIYMIPNYINDAFGVTFGRSLESEIRRYENSRANSSHNGFIGAGSFPRYCIEPKNPFVATKDGEQEVIGNYYVEVIGKERIAYMVKIEDIKIEYQKGVLAFLKKKYGDFEFFVTKSEYRKSIHLVSQKNSERSIIIEGIYGSDMTITYHCKDIEEKYKEKDQVSIGR